MNTNMYRPQVWLDNAVDINNVLDCLDNALNTNYPGNCLDNAVHINNTWD
jgi:hypothetical protein